MMFLNIIQNKDKVKKQSTAAMGMSKINKTKIRSLKIFEFLLDILSNK